MAATEPIKDLKDIEAMKNYFLNVQQNIRNYALFCVGINTALRIGDLLGLKWGHVYSFKKNKYLKHITVKEQKTGKMNVIALNKNIEDALELYKSSLANDVCADDYIFAGRKKGTHLSRSQAYRIIKQASDAVEIEAHISCHSMRKTFGYHAWLLGLDSSTLMSLFNHSSFHITKRYLGIDQDEKDKVFMNLLL